ncbi:MAG: hypothetical protein MZW92_17885 [Comamonadaceae bacterium]|nr:hypothetical protein [Comamonadaceae bacterium]
MSRGSDLIASHDLHRESVYLLKGELRLVYHDDASDVVVGGSGVTLYPLGARPGVRNARAITDLDVIAFDDDLLGAMLTWDQLSSTADEDLPVDTIEKTG